MDYTMLKKQKPMSYTAANLADTLDVNNPINSDYLNDYLCENPWSVKGVETVPGIEFDKDSLSEIISQTIREVLKEESMLVTPKIEKYHIKHR
jgi:hypothetical protein